MTKLHFMKTLSVIKAVALVLSLAVAIPMSGCKKKGCTESNALNYDSDAKKDDGECEFSTVVFKVSSDAVALGSGSTIVKIDGNTIGTIANDGTLSYKLLDGKSHAYQADGTFSVLGVDVTSSETGNVIANANQSSINILLFD